MSARDRARTACLDALIALGGAATRRELVAVAERRGGVGATEVSWALTHLKREGVVENPARAQWRLVRRASVAPPGLLVVSSGSTSAPTLLGRLVAKRRPATPAPAR